MIKNKEEILSKGNEKARSACIEAIEHSLQEIDPSREIRNNVGVSNGDLIIFGETFNLDNFEKVYVLGAGKASFTMAEGLEDRLSDVIETGVVVTKYGYGRGSLNRTDIIEAGHPYPDGNSLKAGEKILKIARNATRNDLVINLISGGGSALLCAPVDSVTLEEMQRTTDLLVDSGATIREINAVRKHLSRIKGGRLAREIEPATCISLIVSDVVGDYLDVIASGPTTFDSTTFDEAHQVLESYALLEEVPRSVVDYISEGIKGNVRESPKEEDFTDANVKNIIISSIDKATEAAAEKAEDLGITPMILSRMIEGESREAGIVKAGILKDIKRSQTPLAPPAMVISGGETTVRLGKEKGEGGPNQEFVLGAASKLSEYEDVTIAAVDTDGTDGPTEVAGGIVDGTTKERLKERGRRLENVLKSHDSLPALKELGDIIITGPTGTNVNDLRIGVVL